MSRAFDLHRDVDVHGVSGEGRVATGVRLDSGLAVVRWLGDKPSWVLWPHFEHAVAVHGHGGLTRFVDIADVPASAAAELDEIARYSLAEMVRWFGRSDR